MKIIEVLDEPILVSRTPTSFKNFVLDSALYVMRIRHGRQSVFESYYNQMKEAAPQNTYRFPIPYFFIKPYKISWITKLRCWMAYSKYPSYVYDFMTTYVHELIWFDKLMKHMYGRKARGGLNNSIFDHFWCARDDNDQYLVAVSFEHTGINPLSKPMIVFRCVQNTIENIECLTADHTTPLNPFKRITKKYHFHYEDKKRG